MYLNFFAPNDCLSTPLEWERNPFRWRTRWGKRDLVFGQRPVGSPRLFHFRFFRFRWQELFVLVCVSVSWRKREKRQSNTGESVAEKRLSNEIEFLDNCYCNSKEESTGRWLPSGLNVCRWFSLCWFFFHFLREHALFSQKTECNVFPRVDCS